MQLQTRNVKVAVEQRAVLSKKLLDLKAGIEQEEADVTKQLTVSADELEIQDKGECHHFQFLQQQKAALQMELQNLEGKQEKYAEIRLQHFLSQAEKRQLKENAKILG